jgi:hypothetical protein
MNRISFVNDSASRDSPCPGKLETSLLRTLVAIHRAADAMATLIAELSNRGRNATRN